MSLQTPLGRVRGLGSAGNGVHHWWVQRLTALALVPLAIWLLVSLLTLPALDFVTVVTWIAGTWTASLLTLFVLIACWHSSLGIQVIFEDYVQDHGLKTLILVLSGFVHAVLAALGVFAVLRIAFGSPL
ncbi:MAG TPA: succinate dehydrogenase, hydrophobic membrane anchor protein [Steroidobacteraceae bacterium]|nr:succinate dehydrogenase, hydrophobic membrane anchor protein [Steroidobacteraceae bacterium]